MKKAFVQLHIAVFLAGFTVILGKLITMNEGLIVWYRMLLAVLFLGLGMLYRKDFTRIGMYDYLKIAGVGLILALHWVTFYGSIRYANASVAVVCLSASGFFSALIEPIIYNKKIILVELLLGMLALIGVWIIFDFHPQYKIGIIFGVISAIGSAAFPIYNKKLLGKFSPKNLIFYEFSGGLIMLSLFLPFYFMKYKPDYYLPTISDWFWLFILAVFCTLYAFNLQLKALQKISAFTYNLTYNLEPIYGIVLAFIIFHEHNLLNGYFYLGLSLIVLAIVLHMFRVMKIYKR